MGHRVVRLNLGWVALDYTPERMAGGTEVQQQRCPGWREFPKRLLFGGVMRLRRRLLTTKSIEALQHLFPFLLISGLPFSLCPRSYQQYQAGGTQYP